MRLGEVDFTPELRAMIRDFAGKTGYATSKECRSFYCSHADADMEARLEDYRNNHAARAAAKETK